uniref:Z band alternatively spliced PDZ-motif protein 52, isoform L n=1 Tax=Drosophila melanogaster TaxID=7227 RepID=A0A0B4KFR8_DROME|nr:Z band alternatively spliced PDZ-motif protein 52, isoform L [Drosophila melanogaster]AGB93537.1 Z band alternatively spliced PDZ-motif protein 52, isoform L [Drosophila melanogaster]|eukprot:NP_001261005.1 Z band alternatively spliced PDZ-motif protein 52, isoform L [Drosophila melanogaster]
MAQPQLLQIKLSRFDAQPWGFRLQGGTDFAQPLLVQKVNAGSLSEQAGLQPGDAVVKINDVDVFNLRHKDAQDIVVRSGNNFVITVQRGGSTWRPHVTPTGNVPQPNSPYLQTVTKTSLAHKQQDSQHIGCGYNNAARPFSNGGDGGVKSIVNKQYNTPVGIYSDESIAETLSAQAEVLAGGVLGVNFKKNEKEYQGDRSEVLKFLREEETGQSTPAFGNSHYEHDAPQQLQQPQQQYNQHQQHYHQQQQQQQSSTTRHVSAPVNSPKPPSTGGLPTGQNICTECERLITGVFVRIKDKNLHVECFKCATCGTSLKNQGYYNFNNKLYCDIHAKQAAINNPPTGTEGYVPVPIKPNTKLSASTISSALNSHGYGGHSNGYSNGNSTPAPAPVASSQATATVATVAPSAATAATAAATPQAATATDSPAATASSSDNMSAYVADEPSSIYGQISAESVALAPPPPQPPTAGGGDQPFEYVTLTGNVIRSVQAPGKGACPSYKVNQGYARPFGAAAPKSPVSYPPQQQQQSPRPAPGGQNPYATLPRSNVGQQGRNVRYQQQQQQQQQYNNQQKQQYRNSYPMGSNYSTPSQSPYITSNTNNYSSSNSYNNNNYSNYNNNNVYRAPGSASAPAPVPSAAPTKATAPFKAPIVPKSVIANAVNAAAPPAPAVFPPDLSDLNLNSNVDNSPGAGGKSAGAFGATSAPKRGRGILNKAAGPGVRIPLCNSCNVQIRGPFITALGRIWCPDHFICVNGNCRRPLQDIGFVEEKGDLYCEYCFEKYLAPTCSKCAGKIKGDCLNAIGKHFHPECFTCGQCGKIFGNRPFFLEDGNAYCEADWNELFTTKCFACGFPVEAGDRWVEALNHNYHSQCFNCTFCKQNLEGQSFYNKGGRPFCKNHAR